MVEDEDVDGFGEDVRGDGEAGEVAVEEDVETAGGEGVGGSGGVVGEVGEDLEM